MTNLVNQFLTTTNFKVTVDGGDFVNLTFFITSFNFPSVTVNSATQPTRKVNIPVPGDTITYEPITMQVLLDSDFTTYAEIYNWLLSMVEDDDNPLRDKQADVTVTFTNRLNNPTKRVVLKNAFPTNIGQIPLDSQDESDAPIKIDLTLAYSHFEIVSV